MKAARWWLVVIVALLVVGLIAFARGPDHQRGDDVGALGSGNSVVWVAVP
ncbi:MAG: hypothetical protein ACRDJ2_10430 [Actinomycetota bacterium]